MVGKQFAKWGVVFVAWFLFIVVAALVTGTDLSVPWWDVTMFFGGTALGLTVAHWVTLHVLCA